jgi:ankyrin repeat protein
VHSADTAMNIHPSVLADEFTTAASQGDRHTVASAVKNGIVCVDAKNRYGQTALHLAVWGNEGDMVALLLRLKADVSICDTKGRNALHFACFRGCKDTVKMLIDKNISLEAADANKDTPLLVAARGDNMNCVNTLLMKNANIYASNNNGDTCLTLAKCCATDNTYNGIKEHCKQFGINMNMLAKRDPIEYIDDLPIFHQNYFDNWQ